MPNGLAGSAQVSYPLWAPSGTAAAPSYSFAAYHDLGLYVYAANQLAIAATGLPYLRVGPGFTEVQGSFILTNSLGTPEVYLGSGGADILAQKRGTNPQEFRVYGTTTGPKYASLSHDGSNVILENFGSSGIYIKQNSSLTWVFSPGAHFQPVTTNSYDIGATGSVPRSIYAGTSFLAPNGSSVAPSYSFSSDPTCGLHFSGAGVGINIFSYSAYIFGLSGSSGFRMAGTISLGWTSGEANATAPDLTLWRDAANVLAQRNGVNAQAFRLYTTYTNASNYERLSIGVVGGVPGMRTEYAGTGTTADLAVVASGAFYFGGSGTNQWVCYGGVIYPLVTGTQDIGHSGGRASSIFLGGNTPAASAPMIDASQTWNDAGVTFVGDVRRVSVTNAALGSSIFSLYGGATGTNFLMSVSPLAADSYATTIYYLQTSIGIMCGGDFRFGTNCRITAPSDGVVVLYNNLSADFVRLCFGGTSALFPAIKRDGANLALVPADGSAGYIDLTVHDVIGSSVYLSNLVGVGANNTNIGLSLTGFAMNIHNSSAALTLAVTGGATLAKFAGAGYLEMYEVTAPSAPAANTGRIYFEDNGAGKTRLMCLFATGSAQQLAIEP